jgi:hypothetical protein
MEGKITNWKLDPNFLFPIFYFSDRPGVGDWSLIALLRS